MDTKTDRKRDLTPAHKQALRIGRQQGHIVREYLDVLEASKPRRGRKPNREKLEESLKEIEQRMETASASKRLTLVSKRKTIVEALERMEPDLEPLREAEAAFIEVAAEYAKRKNISYADFRELGVPAEVLKRANIDRRAA